LQNVADFNSARAARPPHPRRRGPDRGPRVLQLRRPRLHLQARGRLLPRRALCSSHRVLRARSRPPQALAQAAAPPGAPIYFVDDSRANIEAAAALGWPHCAHLVERGLSAVEGGQARTLGADAATAPGVAVIETIDDLRRVWPEIFKRPGA
jgi:hypothetical protein